MTLNWPMLVRMGHRLTVRHPCTMADWASQSYEISPAESINAQPAVHPDGALDRITGLSPWRSWPIEAKLIEGGPKTHAGTKAFVVDDVTVSGPFVYKGATRYDPGYGKERLWDRSGARSIELDDAALVSCFSGSRFFGPFLKDSLPLELLPDDGAHRITMRTRAYGHEAGYRGLFDLYAPPLVNRARIRRLTIYEDFGQNAGKAGRYKTLHDRLRTTLAQQDHPAPVGVYLKRGDTGESRILQNEDALETYLTDLGFDIVEPAQLDADEIAKRTLNTPIVISVEGSHISHVAYSMAWTGTLLVLQPPDRFAMAFKEFTDRVGIRFGFVVGKLADGGFSVDLDELRYFMDRLM